MKNFKKLFLNLGKRKFHKWKVKIDAKVLTAILKKYSIDFYFMDSLGVLTKRYNRDNYEYMLNTGNSCDAIPLMEQLNNRIKNSKISFDIGANIGITTVWLAQNSQKVYAFEPEKNNIFRLRENLEINKIKNVEVIERAMSNKKGIASLNILESYGHHSLGNVKTSKKIGEQKVSLETIDNFCKKKKIEDISVLKVDVEGFEKEVFEGAAQMLKDKKIKLIMFEFSEIPLKSLNRDPIEIYKLLKGFNYEIFYPNMKKFSLDTFKQAYGEIDLLAKPNYRK